MIYDSLIIESHLISQSLCTISDIPKRTTMALTAKKSSTGILNTGDRVGEYKLIEKIGQGGVAEIYRAKQTSLDREVAIKVLSQRATVDSELVTRFEQEAKIIARLSHPNIVHVIDRGVDKGRYYFVMDYILGTNFREVLLKGHYDFKQKIEVVVQLLKALDYAHKNGVVHRDVKPLSLIHI